MRLINYMDTNDNIYWKNSIEIFIYKYITVNPLCVNLIIFIIKRKETILICLTVASSLH